MGTWSSPTVRSKTRPGSIRPSLRQEGVRPYAPALRRVHPRRSHFGRRSPLRDPLDHSAGRRLDRWPRRSTKGCLHRFFTSDALYHGMNAEASGELAYPVDRPRRLCRSRRRSKLFSQQDPILMASHDDDLFGPRRFAARTPHRPAAPSPTRATLRPCATLAMTNAWWPVPMASGTFSIRTSRARV